MVLPDDGVEIRQGVRKGHRSINWNKRLQIPVEARQIEQIPDHRFHAIDAVDNRLADFLSFLVKLLLVVEQQHFRKSADRPERGCQVVKKLRGQTAASRDCAARACRTPVSIG